ncbi:unnamed protein product, partial [Ascophyllum nodosum]
MVGGESMKTISLGLRPTVCVHTGHNLYIKTKRLRTAGLEKGFNRRRLFESDAMWTGSPRGPAQESSNGSGVESENSDCVRHPEIEMIEDNTEEARSKRMYRRRMNSIN